MSLLRHRKTYRHIVDLDLEQDAWLVVEHSLDLVARRQHVLVRHADGRTLLKLGPLPLQELVPLDDSNQLGLMVVGQVSEILLGEDWEVQQ